MPGDLNLLSLPNKVIDSFLKEVGNMHLKEIINEESIKKALVIVLEI